VVCLLTSSADESSSISVTLTIHIRKLNKVCRTFRADPKYTNVVSVALVSNDSDLQMQTTRTEGAKMSFITWQIPCQEKKKQNSNQNKNPTHIFAPTALPNQVV